MNDKTPCAWCLKEMNLKQEPGSHGICARHKAQLLAEDSRLMAIHAVEDAIAKEDKADE